MADAALASLRSNATKLGQRLTENLAEHSRDLGLVDSFAPGASGGSGKYLETASLTPTGVEETKKLLASKRESERSEGLKRVMAMTVKGMPVTQFFPLTTSLLSPTTPLQMRSLVSMYIVHCAATAPEVALLSINAYQKDLSDPNPLVRATALTTLASMQLPDIRSLVGMAVSKGVRDTNWYVRRASAEAILSLYRADPTHDNAQSLLEPVQVLLNTASPLTVASTIAAWEAIFPDKWDLIHRNYRKWCKMLLDTEEWGQCAIMRALTRYARFHFADPDAATVDKDASLLLKAAEPLLWHINPAVVLSAVRLVYYVGPRTSHSKLVQPLLRLLRHPDEIRQVALANMAILAQTSPASLRPHAASFFISSSDSDKVRSTKLDILASLADEGNVSRVLGELTTYVNDDDDDETFSAQAIDALATCATRLPSIARDCLRTMIGLASSSNATIVTRAVSAIRALLAKPVIEGERARTLTHLITLLYHGRITDDAARADVYYLVGQYSDSLDSSLAHEMVRFAAKSFVTESRRAKEAIVTMSAKVLVCAEIANSTDDERIRTLAMLFSYVTALARYDTDYEIRDRARFLKGLVESAQIGTKAEREAARLALAEEEFRKGVSLESYTGTSAEASTTSARTDGDDDDTSGISARQVYDILLQPTTSDLEAGATTTTSEERQLGTFGLLVPGIPDERPLPPYGSSSDSLPDASVRDAPVLSSGTSTMPTNGSSSFSSRSSSPSMNGVGAGAGGGRAGKVVLVPTSSSSLVSDEVGQPGRGRKTDLESFYRDESESEDEEDEDDESTEEDSSDEEEEDEGEEESEGESSEEDEKR